MQLIKRGQGTDKPFTLLITAFNQVYVISIMVYINNYPADTGFNHVSNKLETGQWDFVFLFQTCIYWPKCLLALIIVFTKCSGQYHHG